MRTSLFTALGLVLCLLGILQPTTVAGQPLGEKANYDGKSVKEWTAQLQDRKGDRTAAAFALRMMRADAAPAVPVLIETLADTNEKLGLEAALALVWVGDKAVKDLQQALTDKRPAVRHHAALALAWMGEPHAKTAFSMIENKTSREAMLALAFMGPAAVPGLREALKDPATGQAAAVPAGMVTATVQSALTGPASATVSVMPDRAQPEPPCGDVAAILARR